MSEILSREEWEQKDTRYHDGFDGRDCDALCATIEALARALNKSGDPMWVEHQQTLRDKGWILNE